ncbi:MAG TPA: class I SAM-dependent methyltransferase [Blastocatellia bacterium]|nr:class I SAM-dependent methyltransferase [Blastocatellia bacterium]
MAFTTGAKHWINRVLRGVNLELNTLTGDRIEVRRLAGLERGGHFSEPVFALPEALQRMDPSEVREEVRRHRRRFEDFRDPGANDVGYTFDNPWFSSPDAEVLYAVVRRYRPQRIIEVGCGYSTRIIRQAIFDGGLGSRLVCIDPAPREDVTKLADEFHRKPVEQVPPEQITGSLDSSDILFIDSSHTLTVGGDVAFIYLDVLPMLRPGALVHIHDVFLPYDYPRKWVLDEHRGFNEQYVVQAILTCSDAFEVLWAGHHLQRTCADFASWFPQLGDRWAQSFWMRKRC